MVEARNPFRRTDSTIDVVLESPATTGCISSVYSHRRPPTSKPINPYGFVSPITAPSVVLGVPHILFASILVASHVPA